MNPTLAILNEITICFRFAIRFLKTAVFVSIGSVVSIAKIDYNKKFGFINFNGAGYMYIWQNDIVPDKWHHLCYSFAGNEIHIVLDGIPIFHKDMINLPAINLNLSNLDLSIGYLSQNKLPQRFSGLMTEVNVWSKGLKLNDMIEITSKCLEITAVKVGVCKQINH